MDMDNTESARPEAPPAKQNRKTLLIVVSFFAALGLLVALNMK